MYNLYLTVLLSLWICVYGNPNTVECPNRFIPLHKSCYYFATTTATWAEATKACHSMGAQLVSIETAEESLAINLHLLYEYSAGANFWTSGTDVHTEGRFKWMGSNKYFNYTLWCGNSPDNNKGDEHCLELLKRPNYRICWNDAPCNSRVGTGGYPMYFLCEHEVKQ